MRTCILLIIVNAATAFRCPPQPLHHPRSFSSRHTTVRADEGGAWSSLIDLLNTPPIIIRYEEVFDPDKDLGIREIPSGVSLTPSGFFAIFIIGVQQLWAPWGIVKYKQRLKDDEQAWLDLGVSPEQAVTRAYNNMRPPPKVEMKADDEPQEDAEQAADSESE